MTQAQSAMYEGGIQRVLDLLDGYQNTCIILAASRIELFEKLASGPRTLDTLAAEVRLPPSTLNRLIRGLLVLGLVERQAGEIHLTHDGRLMLKQGGAGDIAVLVREQYLQAWAHLSDSLSTGEPAFEKVFGMSVWEHRRKHPEVNEAFNHFAQRPQREALRTFLDSYDLSRFSRVADIGGGNGYLLTGVLERHPGVTGILFDQLHVIDGARDRVRSAGFGERCELIAGSFFDDVPAGADLYILQYILHDWDDGECVRILRNCHRAMASGATLLILEKVLPSEDAVPRFLVMRDLHMLTVLGGRERTLEQYAALLSAAGFRVERYTPLAAHCSDIIEARR